MSDFEKTVYDFYHNYQIDYERLFVNSDGTDAKEGKEFFEKYKNHFRMFDLIIDHIDPEKSMQSLYAVSCLLHEKVLRYIEKRQVNRQIPKPLRKRKFNSDSIVDIKSLKKRKFNSDSVVEIELSREKVKKTKVTFPIEIWREIIFYTVDIHEEPRFIKTCDDMYDIYQDCLERYVKSVKSLNPEKHVFYQKGVWRDPLVFNFRRIVKTGKAEYVEFDKSYSLNAKDQSKKVLKRMLKYNKDLVPYCRSPRNNELVYKIDRDLVCDVNKERCDACDKSNYCKKQFVVLGHCGTECVNEEEFDKTEYPDHVCRMFSGHYHLICDECKSINRLYKDGLELIL
jgi:hypothetical protein